MSNVIVVVGAQWGDEGKGKIVDVLSKKADVVARYQGGHNAGHTVVINDDKFILHMIPSGILYRDKICLVGNGVVVDPSAFIEEINGLKERGVSVGKNLLLSKNAHMIMPYHIVIDIAKEKALREKSLGTTGRGIGPAYVDKMARVGLRTGDLLQPAVFKEKLSVSISTINFLLENLYNAPSFKVEDIYSTYMGYAEKLSEYITDTDMFINKMLSDNKNILCEGAQGTLLDIDHGTYPFVTSSNPVAGGACTGLGISPLKISGIIGVIKAYTTRVGSGPFPTELRDSLGETFRERGGEYGATTGRPRRCGWLDMVSLRHSVMINGFTGIALTKLDILDGVEKIRICTSYKYNGSLIDLFPKELSILEQCEPVYAELEGWTESTSGITHLNRLPKAARAYIQTIESMLGVEVQLVSTGQRRDELIVLKEQFT